MVAWYQAGLLVGHALAAVGLPGAHVELEAAVVPVAGGDGPVPAGLAVGHAGPDDSPGPAGAGPRPGGTGTGRTWRASSRKAAQVSPRWPRTQVSPQRNQRPSRHWKRPWAGGLGHVAGGVTGGHSGRSRSSGDRGPSDAWADSDGGGRTAGSTVVVVAASSAVEGAGAAVVGGASLVVGAGATVVAGTVDGLVSSLSLADATPPSTAPMRLRASVRHSAVSPIFLFIVRTGGCAPSGDYPHRTEGARQCSEVRGSPAGPEGQRLERAVDRMTPNRR